MADLYCWPAKGAFLLCVVKEMNFEKKHEKTSPHLERKSSKSLNEAGGRGSLSERSPREVYSIAN